jgi:hypothetical protein
MNIDEIINFINKNKKIIFELHFPYKLKKN